MSRERLAAVVGLVVAGALVILASTQTWVTAALVGARPVHAAGSAAFPALAAEGVVFLAGAGALAIAGRVARIVIGVLLLPLAAGVVAGTLPVITDPVRGVASAISAATGVAGDHSVRALVTAVEVSGWPWCALAGALVVVLTGLFVLIRSPRWPAGGRRYEREPARQAGPVRDDPVDEWDVLSKGEDPTGDDPVDDGPASGGEERRDP